MVFFAFFCYFRWQKRVAFAFDKKQILGIIISIVFICLGFLRTYFSNELRLPQHFSSIKKANVYEISVKNQIIEKAKFQKAYCIVNKVMDSLGKSHAVQGKVLVYFNKKHFKNPIKAGDIFVLDANVQNIDAPKNPEEFDYKQYLSYHNIHYQLFASESAIQLPKTTFVLRRWAQQARESCLNILRTHFKDKKVLGVAEALLLGFKDNLDPVLVNSFSQTGTLHVLAVSGLHAGIIYFILLFSTSFLLKLKNGMVTQTIIVILGIWVYAFVTGLSASVLRSSLMFSVIGGAKLFNRKGNVFNTIYISAFILLLINPLDIVNVSFQLSYSAVLGIVFVQPLIKNWYIPHNRFDKYCWGLVSVSFAAQLFTFPLGVYYFHQFPNYFLLSNLIIIPLVLIILVGLIALLVFNFVPFLGVLLAFIVSKIIVFNNYLVQSINHFPGSYFNGLHLDFWQLLILYTLIFLLLSFLIHRHKWLFFSFMITTVCYIGIESFQNYKEHRQKKIVFHKIKNHDVITCIQGKRVYIISDSAFVNDALGIKFFLEPYFWKNGVNTLITIDISKNYNDYNFKLSKNLGFQFFNYKCKFVQRNIDFEENCNVFLLKNKYLADSVLLKNKHKTLLVSNLINIRNPQVLLKYDTIAIKNTKQAYCLSF